MVDEPELSVLWESMRDRLRRDLEGLASELGLRTRVLVVDDDLDSARLIQRFLERRGHPVCLAHDLHDALLAAHRFEPDVVILDVGLPSGDGCDLAPSLREVCGKTLRIVGLSGYDGHRHRARAEAAGFDVYLVKPASLRAVATEVEIG